MKKFFSTTWLQKVAVVSMLILVGTWFFSRSAIAETSACSGINYNNINVPDTANSLNWGDLFIDMVYAIQGAGKCMSGIFIADGAILALTLFGISLTLAIFVYLLEPASPTNYSNIAMLILKVTLVMVMLGAWSSGGREGAVPDWLPKNTLGGETVESSLVKPFDELANGVFSKYNSWTGGSGGKSAVFNALSGSWRDLWSANAERGKIRDAVRSQIDNPLTWIKTWIEGIGDSIVTLIVSVFVFLAIAVLMVSYVFVLYFGDVIAIVGMILGPLMIPGLLFKPLDFLFTNWLKLMISAGFYKIIAAVVAMLTLVSVSHVQAIANKMYLKFSNVNVSMGESVINGTALSAGFILSMVMTVLFLLFGIFLMWKVSHLTQYVMSGQGGMAAHYATQAGTSAVKSVASVAGGGGGQGGGGGLPQLGSFGGVPGFQGGGKGHRPSRRS